MKKLNVKDRLIQFFRRYKLNNVANQENIYDLEPITGTVQEEGTPLDASLFKDIDDNFDELSNKASLTDNKIIIINEELNRKLDKTQLSNTKGTSDKDGYTQKYINELTEDTILTRGVYGTFTEIKYVKVFEVLMHEQWQSEIIDLTFLDNNSVNISERTSSASILINTNTEHITMTAILNYGWDRSLAMMYACYDHIYNGNNVISFYRVIKSDYDNIAIRFNTTANRSLLNSPNFNKFNHSEQIVVDTLPNTTRQILLKDITKWSNPIYFKPSTSLPTDIAQTNDDTVFTTKASKLLLDRQSFNKVYRNITEVPNITTSSTLSDLLRNVENNSLCQFMVDDYPKIRPQGSGIGCLFISTVTHNGRNICQYMSNDGRLYKNTVNLQLGTENGWKEIADTSKTFSKVYQHLGEIPNITKESTIEDLMINMENRSIVVGYLGGASSPYANITPKGTNSNGTIWGIKDDRTRGTFNYTTQENSIPRTFQYNYIQGQRQTNWVDTSGNGSNAEIIGEKPTDLDTLYDAFVGKWYKSNSVTTTQNCVNKPYAEGNANGFNLHSYTIRTSANPFRTYQQDYVSLNGEWYRYGSEQNEGDTVIWSGWYRRSLIYTNLASLGLGNTVNIADVANAMKNYSTAMIDVNANVMPNLFPDILKEKLPSNEWAGLLQMTKLGNHRIDCKFGYKTTWDLPIRQYQLVGFVKTADTDLAKQFSGWSEVLTSDKIVPSTSFPTDISALSDDTILSSKASKMLVENTSLSLLPNANGAVNPNGRKNDSAIGKNSTAIGCDANATVDNSTAIGYNASATNLYSVAIGNNSKAIAKSAVAIGSEANAKGQYSAALAFGSISVGDRSLALGSEASSGGNYSIAIGSNSASASYSIAIGRNSKSSTSYSIAIGDENVVNGLNGVAIGRLANATGGNSTAIGVAAKAGSQGSVALGSDSRVTAEEERTVRLGDNSLTSSLKCRVQLSVISDERDKTDIINIENKKSLEFINRLDPIQYVDNSRTNYITEAQKQSEEFKQYGMINDYDRIAYLQGTKKGKRKRIGLKAQQVQKTIKEIFGSENYANIVDDNFYDLKQKGESPNVENKLTMAYANLIPFLIGAIKEQQKQIDKQQIEINDIKTKLKQI